MRWRVAGQNGKPGVLRSVEGGQMDQPTAEQALQRLEPLVGQWSLEAGPPGGPAWPGDARTTIGWHDSGAHVVQRSTVDVPEAPDGVSIIGCDAANGSYVSLHSDERGVCRIYQMSLMGQGVEALA